MYVPNFDYLSSIVDINSLIEECLVPASFAQLQLTYVILIGNNILQGIWKPQKIANPDYFEDKEPFKMTPIVSSFNTAFSMTYVLVIGNRMMLLQL